MITRIMANTECCVSTTCNDACSSASHTMSSSNLLSASINDNIHCNCQHRSGTRNCSLKQRNYNSSSTIINKMPVTSPVFLITILIVFVIHFTCCVSAWPILNHRRTYNYAPPSVVIPDYNELAEINQWALAAQPDTYYDTSIPLQQPQIDEDLYDDAPIYDQEPDIETYQMPLFGPIVDTVEPEEELELEELKHQQPYRYEKRRQAKVAVTVKPSVSSSHPSVTSTVATTPSSTTSSSLSSSSSKKVAIAKQQLLIPSKQQNGKSGQKEIAMLRPPSPVKSHHIQLEDPEEPKISVAQRSPSNEKPSAYDRLRKYLSLDDALKKEYQQRRANAMNRRHTKRESVSSIITDSDSLTGQLNNLKKKID